MGCKQPTSPCLTVYDWEATIVVFLVLRCTLRLLVERSWSGWCGHIWYLPAVQNGEEDKNKKRITVGSILLQMCELLFGGKLSSRSFTSVPPGPPQIEGYHDGDIVQVGDKLNLACISRGGNPAARLIWFRNNEQVDITYSTGGREATNTHTFTVGPKDNKAVYKCEASNVVTNQPLTASVRLNVLFAPTKVTISGPKEVRVGESITLSCTTGSSNPPVEVSWVVDGRPMMSTQAVTEDIAGGWVTSSNVTVSVSRQFTFSNPTFRLGASSKTNCQTPASPLAILLPTNHIAPSLQPIRRLLLSTQVLLLMSEGEKDFNDDHGEEITDFVQSIPGFQECDEDVETWMACDAEDCGFQMLNDDEIVTSVQENPTLLAMKRMKKRTTTTKVARVHQMLTRFLR
ncbi:nephrin [Trichonephila clavipes]|nr:nephrin [Trichonephila clavipes]